MIGFAGNLVSQTVGLINSVRKIACDGPIEFSATLAPMIPDIDANFVKNDQNEQK